MLSANHFPAPHEKYLYKSVVKGSYKGYNITVINACVRHFLSFLYAFYVFYLIPVCSRRFKIQIFCGFFHFFLHFFNYVVMLSIKKIHCLVNKLFVFLAAYFTITWGAALAYMVIKAWPFLSYIPWQHLFAFS